MELIKQYIQIAQEVIQYIHEYYLNSSETNNHFLIKDEKTNNYLILMNEWEGAKRFYGILIHIEIKDNGIVWVHEDNTDLIVVDYLLDKGIEKKNIVIGWHHPKDRKNTEFALGN